MALLWFENFDKINNNTVLEAIYDSTLCTMTAGNPIDSPASGYYLDTGSNGSVRITSSVPGSLPGSSTIFVQGFFAFTDTGTERPVIEFSEGNTTHVRLMRQADGAFRFDRNTTSLGGSATSATGQFSQDVWMYLEMKIVIHDSTGEVVLKKDSVEIINATGLDTRNGGTSGVCNDILFQVRQRVDEVFVFDTTDSPTGTVFSDFIGQRRVVSITPDGAGTTSQFTGVGSATNYENVDDAAFDATDYNESNTNGHKDTFSMSDLPLAASTIDAVAVRVYAGKDNSNPRQITPVIRVSGTDYSASTDTTLDLGDSLYWYAWEDNPDTAAAWSESEVNAIEAGYENTTP